MEQNKKILIVDDSFSQRILLGSFIEILDLEYQDAENGKIAIEILEKNQDFGVIFMDIEMPILNGIEATIKIRNTNWDYKDIPIIAITGHDNSKKSELLASGFTNIVTKPYTFDKFLDIINNL